MPLPFLGSRNKKKNANAPAQRVNLPPDTLEFEEAAMRLQYHSMSSHGVRLPHNDSVPVLLPNLLEGFARQVELIEPLDESFQNAAPQILRPQVALEWINAHHSRSQIGRHALFILESLDAIDLAYETFAVALLTGDLDGEGFPRYDAVVGGPISYWDEASGDLIVRMALCWGGEGVKGDTQRGAQKLLARLISNLLASQGATELGRVERPVAVAGQQRAACPHCGFPAARPARTLLPQVRNAHGRKLGDMPLYDYQCQNCGHVVEVMHGVHDLGPQRCERCDGPMRKLISSPAIVFKGSGWAKNDARSSRPSGAAKSATDTDSDSGSAKSEPAKTESGAGSDSKPAGADTAA